jgi:hypothetical protein
MVVVGFNPRFRCSPTACVAERRMNPSLTIFRCRSATQYQFGLAVHRGLKPTATLKPLLRDDPSELRTLRQVAVRPARPVWPSERARASQSRIGNPQTVHCTCGLADRRLQARKSLGSTGRWPVGFGSAPKPLSGSPEPSYRRGNSKWCVSVLFVSLWLLNGIGCHALRCACPGVMSAGLRRRLRFNAIGLRPSVLRLPISMPHARCWRGRDALRGPAWKPALQGDSRLAVAF